MQIWIYPEDEFYSQPSGQLWKTVRKTGSPSPVCLDFMDIQMRANILLTESGSSLNMMRPKNLSCGIVTPPQTLYFSLNRAPYQSTTYIWQGFPWNGLNSKSLYQIQPKQRRYSMKQLVYSTLAPKVICPISLCRSYYTRTGAQTKIRKFAPLMVAHTNGDGNKMADEES